MGTANDHRGPSQIDAQDALRRHSRQGRIYAEIPDTLAVARVHRRRAFLRSARLCPKRHIVGSRGRGCRGAVVAVGDQRHRRDRAPPRGIAAGYAGDGDGGDRRGTAGQGHHRCGAAGTGDAGHQLRRLSEIGATPVVSRRRRRRGQRRRRSVVGRLPRRRLSGAPRNARYRFLRHGARRGSEGTAGHLVGQECRRGRGELHHRQADRQFRIDRAVDLRRIWPAQRQSHDQCAHHKRDSGAPRSRCRNQRRLPPDRRRPGARRRKQAQRAAPCSRRPGRTQQFVALGRHRQSGSVGYVALQRVPAALHAGQGLCRL